MSLALLLGMVVAPTAWARRAQTIAKSMTESQPDEITVVRPIVDGAPVFQDLSGSGSNPIPTPTTMGYRGLPDLSRRTAVQGQMLDAAREVLEKKGYRCTVASPDSLTAETDSAAVLATVPRFDHALVIAITRVEESLDQSSLDAKYGGDEWAARLCGVEVRATLYEKGAPTPLWDDLGTGGSGPVLLRRLRATYPEESRQAAFILAIRAGVKDALATLPKHRSR